MFIVLPPSETKAAHGDGPALDLDALTFPGLRPQREELIGAVRRLAADPASARAALKVGPAKDGEIAANALLCRAPTLPAVHRFTGVLYEALGAGQMSAAEFTRARARLLIASALFGMLAAGDAIPAYRLSAGSVLPRIGGVTALWKAALPTHLAGIAGPVVDLRSGAYAAFGSIPGAITVRVVTAAADGSLSVVSHLNKATKGRLARLLATTRAEVRGASDVIRLARRAGIAAERTGPATLQIVT